MQTGRQNAQPAALSPIGRRIQEALAAFLQREPSTIRPGHHLREDLGLDSLMTFELLYELEKAFDLEIPNEDLPGLQTLADISGYVEARVRPSSPAPRAASGTSRSGGKQHTPKTAMPSTEKSPGAAQPRTATQPATRHSGAAVKPRATSAKRKRKKP